MSDAESEVSRPDGLPDVAVHIPDMAADCSHEDHNGQDAEWKIPGSEWPREGRFVAICGDEECIEAVNEVLEQ